MLLQLEIHNVALIEKVSIQLDKGLNILTGETGAGKSIIIDAINAVLGERVSKELIRTGTEKALVEAVFRFENNKIEAVLESLGIEPEEDGTLIISREFTMSGRNICRINGKLVTVSTLKETGEAIIDIHGQYDNQSLLRTESHIELLDSYAGPVLYELKKNYKDTLGRYRDARNRLKELSGSPEERERRIDLLKFQLDEIGKARLKAGEEEELNRQKILLSSSEKILGTLSRTYELLFSGNNIRSSSSDNINEALGELGNISRLDEKYEDIWKRLQDLSYQMEDVIEDIRRERDSVEFSPDQLEQIEERLDLIYKLKRKYGSTIEAILEYAKKVEAELEQIVKSEETVNRIRSEIDTLNEELFILAGKMSGERKKAAEELEIKVSSELEDLEMKKAKFKVGINFDGEAGPKGENRYNGNGLDRIEFLISPNPGEPLKPLSKIASGGEMSRIMLAIKTILADYDEMPTLIFDEIDMGISGRAAQKVGEKLSYISRGHQVLCVTHLAQIACMADEHYLIEKVSSLDRTDTRVTKLEKRNRMNEIARLLGGTSISEITLKHAEEMLLNANKQRTAINS